MDIKNSLWVAKYAPNNLDETILSNHMKAKMQEYIENKEIPNLGLFGPAGTGKTSTMKVLLEEMGVDKADIKFVNASDINSVDSVRMEIKPFAQSGSIDHELGMRIVFLDEADHLSPQAQAALRNLIEATYSSARFILTANYPKKIIPALHSRLQTYILEKPDLNSIAERMVEILENEKVSIDNEDDFLDLIKNNAHDIRKLIQLMQQNTTTNKKGKKVLKVESTANESTPLFEEYLKLFKKNDAKALRNLIFTKFTDTDIVEFWTLMIEELVKNPDEYEEIGMGLDNTIYHLNEGQKNHEMVANKQLNLLGFTIMALDVAE